MHKFCLAVVLLLLCCLTVDAGNKQKGSVTLKDLQPANTPDKNNKNQMYDFIFTNAGNNYTCRTEHDKKLKATDFIVGNDLKFELDGDKAKLKNASGKEVKCTVVRVEKSTASGN
jgi:mannose/fructose/N-acetylgalactosamine-specific phosphotransferase system component IIB